MRQIGGQARVPAQQRRCFASSPLPPQTIRLPHRLQQQRRRWRLAAAAAASPVLSISDSLKLVQRLEDLAASASSTRVAPKRFAGDAGERVGFTAKGDVTPSSAVVVVSEKAAITRVDAEQHELVGEVAAECSELVALTLWLLAERSKREASTSHALLSTLPASTLSPILWSDAEIKELLAGSPVEQEALSRKAALQQQWRDLQQGPLGQDASKYPPSVFNERAFQEAFAVVLAHAVYLPSASCFALVPLVSQLGRTGSEVLGCQADYDAEAGTVVVTSGGKVIKSGTEVQLYDPRPNGELLLATGSVPDQNPANCLLWNACLIPADKYFMMKEQILETLGFGATEQFPVFADRFPNQLLAYLRLSRVADPALFAKVSFEQDVELSQMNEYEILQIIMGDCREKLQAYTLSFEEDVKLAQQPNLTPQQRLAVKLRLSEKKIISATMDAVRTRLAPIRGIPTKSGGMQDPNSDLREIFDALESIPAAPARLVGGFLSWARGEQDPDWGKKPSDKPKAPRPW